MPLQPSRKEALTALAAAAALAVPALLAAGQVLERMGADRPFDVEVVPRGEQLRHLSPSLQLSVADLYWLLTVQYVGEPKREKRGFEKLYPLVDLVTDLDPRHGYAYQTGGIVLSSQLRLDESDAILEKGMEPGRPNWWTYPFYLAFNDYFYRGDYESASRWAEIAARTKGASTNIAHLALAMKVKSGDPAEAVRLVDALLAVATDESTVEALTGQRKLALLQLHFATLDRAVAAYRERHGRPPGRLEALVSEGLLAALPEEPYGGRFTIDEAGEVGSSGKGGYRLKPAEKGRLQLLKRSPIPGPWKTP
jgi:tetratricopeptide (TPR) repeat protein